jgi:Na+/phosphate symporter
MSREDTLVEIDETAARVEMRITNLLSRLSRGPSDSEIVETIREVLTLLRNEDARRDQAYTALEERIETVTCSLRDFMQSVTQRERLGRELVEERAEALQIRRELLQRSQVLEKSLREAAEALRSAADGARAMTNSRILNLSLLVGSKLHSSARCLSSATSLAHEKVEQCVRQSEQLSERLKH